MSPPLVRFSWRRQKENGPPEELEGEPLELRESGCTTAIVRVDANAVYTYKYFCSVQHEGGTVEAQIQQEAAAAPSTSPPPPPSTAPSTPTPPAPSAPASTAPSAAELLRCTVAILRVDTDAVYTYKYFCSVQHEGCTVEAQTQQEAPAAPTTSPPPPSTAPSTLTPPPLTAPTTPTPPPLTAPTTPTPPSLTAPTTSTPPPPSTPASTAPSAPPLPPSQPSGPSQYQVKLLCVLYTVLIVKSLVYCCGLSLLMSLKNKGPSTN